MDADLHDPWPRSHDEASLLARRGGGGRAGTASHDLLARGLLHRDAKTNRFDLHPIVRRYAYDRLGGADRTASHARLRDYFAALPPVEKPRTLDDLAPVIELYHHTLRAGQYDEARTLFRDRISTATYYQFGAYQLRIELLAGLFPGGDPITASGRAALPRLKNESAQAWTLNELANSYGLSGQPRRAVPLFEGHNAIYEKRGDKTNLAIGLGNLAYQQMVIGALIAAEASLRRSIALCREIGDEFWEAVGHQELGRLLAYRGAWAESAAELDAALGMFEKQKQIQSQGIVWAYRALRALLMARDLTPRPSPDPTSSGIERGGGVRAARRALELADEDARRPTPSSATTSVPTGYWARRWPRPAILQGSDAWRRRSATWTRRWPAAGRSTWWTRGGHPAGPGAGAVGGPHPRPLSHPAGRARGEFQRRGAAAGGRGVGDHGAERVRAAGRGRAPVPGGDRDGCGRQRDGVGACAGRAAAGGVRRPARSHLQGRVRRSRPRCWRSWGKGAGRNRTTNFSCRARRHGA